LEGDSKKIQRTHRTMSTIQGSKAHNYYAPQLCVAVASRADEAVSLARTICAMEDRSTVFPQTEDPRLRDNWRNYGE
jgi:hypothetical protein